ncbi:MAG: amidase, partial [Proteobacteria bacterium]|nr:amidase [Pseudomonadota bacterium]MBU1581536.1 amidase [Pseudomonadota bacterium]
MSIKIASSYCNDVLGTSDGVEIAKLIANNEVKESEVLEAAINRAEKINPDINGISTKAFDLLLDETKTSKGNPFFKGVPSFIKDNDDVKGLSTLYGSRSVTNKPVQKSSEFVELYNSLGFRTLGKSTLPELGLTCSTESLATGPTRNPWNLDHSTGGSSGGAAALVASGVVPIAHGNDGGGSIRIPASCCGLVGLKPSRGRLPGKASYNEMPVNIICNGILSRTVRDTAIFYAEAEKIITNHKLPKIGLIEHPGKKRLKIGMVNTRPDETALGADIAGQIQKVAKCCEELGHKVEEITFPFQKKIMDDFIIYWAALAFYFYYFGKKVTGDTVDKKQLEKLTVGFSKLYKKNILKTPFVIRRLKKFSNQYAAFFNDYDLLLTPTTSTPPPKIGYLDPNLEFDTSLERLIDFVPYT